MISPFDGESSTPVAEDSAQDLREMWNAYTPVPNCFDCHYFDPIRHTDAGICHRFPKSETVLETYWCGEFSVKVNHR
jgi:hypothetical protein